MKKYINNKVHTTTWFRIGIVLTLLVTAIYFAYSGIFLKQPPVLQSAYIGGIVGSIGAVFGFSISKILFNHKVNWRLPLKQQSTAAYARIIFAIIFAYLVMTYGSPI